MSNLPPVPTGIQRLLGRAAADDRLAEDVLARRADAADAAGIALTARERAILAAVPPELLRRMIASVAPVDDDRRDFLRATAAAAVTALGGAALASCDRDPAPPAAPAASPAPRDAAVVGRPAGADAGAPAAPPVDAGAARAEAEPDAGTRARERTPRGEPTLGTVGDSGDSGRVAVRDTVRVGGAAPDPPKPAARVDVKRPVVIQGEIDLAALQSALRKYSGAFAACYRQALGENPELAGPGVWRVELGAEGKATAVEPRKIFPGGETLAACIRARLRHMAYPAPGGEVTFDVELVFAVR